MSARRGAVAAVAVVVLAACSGSGDGDRADGGTQPSDAVDVGGSPTTTAPAASGTAEVPALPPESPAGTGVIVVGGTSSTFAVSTCRLEPDGSEPPGAQTLVAVDGAGTTGAGVPFTIELQRFATGTDVITFTDTVTYTDSGRILQAQRIEVAGQVTDLRDPDATSALVRVRADGVTAAGLAGPPGAVAGDEGITGIALDATCP